MHESHTTFHEASVPRLLGFHRRWAPVVALGALTVETALAWQSGTLGAPLAGYLLSFVSLATGLVLLVRSAPDPFPLGQTVVVVAVPAVAAAANAWEQAARGTEPGYYAWSWIYAALILGGASLRGRPGLAAAGLAAAVATHVLAGHLVWGLAESGIVSSAVVLVVTTVVLVLLARRLRGQMLATHSMRDQRLEVAMARAEALAILGERDRHLQQLRAAVAVTFAPALAGRALTEAERAQCLLVEARLRDRVRARALATPAVEEVVGQARAQGVLVQLLDDGGVTDSSAVELAHLAAVVTREVRAALGGHPPATEVTVRVPPPRRATVCTIVVERCGGLHRRVTLARDGSVATVEAVGDAPPPGGDSGQVTRSAPRRG